VAAGALTALASAAPAGAGEVQDAATGDPYTGAYATLNSDDAVVSSGGVHFTCAESSF
jgi:hypothetical protein